MAFKYSALSATDSKRLLKVLPGNDDGVHVELFEETGDTPYRCLSYTWGEPLPTFPIDVNGCRMQVGQSLHEFLVTASKRFASEPLWIDALCINQEDDHEKSVQVQRMGIIYKEAFEVLIWLGDDFGIATFFDWMRKPKRWLLHFKPSTRTPRHLREAATRCADHPYWSRTWIMQEVLLARSLRLLAGRSEAYPEDFSKYPPLKAIISLWAQLSVFRTKFYGYRYESRHDIRFFLDKVQSLKGSKSLDFWQVMALTHDSFCRDDRDRIYSVLAVIGEEYGFRVNYHESYVSTFQRCADHFNAWCSPARVHNLWNLLGLTTDLVVEANLSRQYLRCEIPMPRSKMVPHAQKKAEVKFRITRCDQQPDAIRYVGIPGSQPGDLLLCSQSHYTYASTHVVLRQCEGADTELFKILFHFERDFKVLPYCASDMELWFVSNGNKERVIQWKDAVRKSKLQREVDEDWASRPYFLVKLNQDYLFLCVNPYSR